MFRYMLVDFKSRVVPLNRDTVLAEFTTPDIAEFHGSRLIGDDFIAVSPTISARRLRPMVLHICYVRR